jgi:hypothetical protein
MKKLSLDVDALEIDSFETAAADEARGTVHAASDIESYDCSNYWYCVPYPSRGCD